MTDTAALVALLRESRRDPKAYSHLVEDAGSAQLILEEEHGLLADELAAAAAEQIQLWERSGIRLLTVLDPGYPENLRAVHDRPPLIFVDGSVSAADARSVAVIGSRKASPDGLATASEISARLVERGYTVISGLARGVDTAVHAAALRQGGRTLAVIGNGIGRCYPPENAELQRQIAAVGAVISQFWPDSPPAKAHFPLRNGLMSGMSLASVIVEAGPTSGARIQARLALGHGRPVLLLHGVMDQDWARELAKRPAVYVADAAEDVPALIDQLASSQIQAI